MFNRTNELHVHFNFRKLELNFKRKHLGSIALEVLLRLCTLYTVKSKVVLEFGYLANKKKKERKKINNAFPLYLLFQRTKRNVFFS